MPEDLKVYTPTEIPETPFPQEGQADFETTQKTANDTYSPKATKEISFPQVKIATEVLSTALNTRSKKILQAFEFTPSGAIQVGKYEPGVSGDIRISPNGIVARNQLGNQTFALDGDTGDAVFAGIIQAGTLISGAVAVGDGNILIDGATKRMLFYDSNGIPNIVIGLIS